MASIAPNGTLPQVPSAPVDPLTLAQALRTTPKHSEAPASINAHIVLAGVTCQLTLRDVDEWRLLDRMEAVLLKLRDTGAPAPSDPQPTPPRVPQPPLEERPDWCTLHGSAMARQSNGSGSWFSHKTPEGWCNGKRKRAGA